jgi:2-oxoglutarate dehydrogenase E1 component
VSRFVEFAKHSHVAKRTGTDEAGFAQKQAAVQSLILAYRMVGTRNADLDPLQWTVPAPEPALSPGYFGLSQADMQTRFNTLDTCFSSEDMTLSELVQALSETYSGTLSAEFMHLADASQRNWWQMRLESTRSKPTLDLAERLHILERLTAAEGFEKYLHARYVGQKRFSLEGSESLIVLLDELIAYGTKKGVRHAVLGMAHRGRLNVLVNIVGKPFAKVFDEFDAKSVSPLLADDVKYHKGFTGQFPTAAGPTEVTLAFNPSHLEIVNPVVQGIARAHAEMTEHDQGAVLPVEIHGDASIAGQGIVMETLSLSNTRGFGTGGTVHVVVNNQVGFTTSDPRDTRSSFYCTDIAKMIEAPILHVNGDDPEAVAAATRLAIDFRATFGKSVVIELVCFRRYGHQEQDTPDITQPLMYRAVARHPGVRTVYAKKLINEGVVTEEAVDEYVHGYRKRLEAAQTVQGNRSVDPTHEGAGRAPAIDGSHGCSIYYAAPSPDLVKSLALKISTVPEQYTLHPLVGKAMSARREMAEGKRPLDWGMGEHMALASLLAAGVDVRLSGQDSERGTFSHRHAVLHDQKRSSRGEGSYIPLSNISDEQGRFSIINSILSEAAVLAFEYGYSVVRQSSLVLWEAQFGDFANTAQVVIDNFLSAGAAKWGQSSGLTLLLPHGQEGQGPEHASARLERYLQLCAQGNMRVCQPTTPAQIFHLLRAQAMLHDRVPLVVMTPKSLLRHPEAVSSLADLARGSSRKYSPKLQQRKRHSRSTASFFVRGRSILNLSRGATRPGKTILRCFALNSCIHSRPARSVLSWSATRMRRVLSGARKNRRTRAPGVS